MTMSEANVSGIARRAELSAKVEAVDAAIEAAYDAMCDMGADEYFAALESSLSETPERAKGSCGSQRETLTACPRALRTG